jgi:hypothetical protein
MFHADFAGTGLYRRVSLSFADPNIRLAGERDVASNVSHKLHST